MLTALRLYYIQLMSSEFLTLPRNDLPCATSYVELLEPEIRAGWCCNHHFENNPKAAGRPLQSGGTATVRWETQHFGLEAAGDTETPRHRDALKCEARADPNGAVQSMQTPVLGPKICLHFSTWPIMGLRFTTRKRHGKEIENAIEKTCALVN